MDGSKSQPWRRRLLLMVEKRSWIDVFVGAPSLTNHVIPLPGFTSPTRPLPPFLAIFYCDFSSTIRAYSYFRWWYCLSFYPRLSSWCSWYDHVLMQISMKKRLRLSIIDPFYFGVSIGFVNPTWDGGFFFSFFLLN